MLDFWAGTFGIVFFAAVEIVIFSWVFGIRNGWEELHKGADIKIPRIFRFIIKYVTPIYLLGLLVVWTYQEAISKFFMKGEPEVRHPYLWGARGLFFLFILITVVMVKIAWKKGKGKK